MNEDLQANMFLSGKLFNRVYMNTNMFRGFVVELNSNKVVDTIGVIQTVYILLINFKQKINNSNIISNYLK